MDWFILTKKIKSLALGIADYRSSDSGIRACCSVPSFSSVSCVLVVLSGSVVWQEDARSFRGYILSRSRGKTKLSCTAMPRKDSVDFIGSI